MNIVTWKYLLRNSLAIIALFLALSLTAPANEIEFDGYTVHYTVVTTDLLSPEVARAYGLSRSRNRALVNIVVMETDASGSTRSIPARVQGTGVNLNQQSRAMRFREVRDADAYYHLAEIPIRRGEVINFSLQIRTDGIREPLSVQFRQAFFAH
jgi:hypothetical protein